MVPPLLVTHGVRSSPSLAPRPFAAPPPAPRLRLPRLHVCRSWTLGLGPCRPLGHCSAWPSLCHMLSAAVCCAPRRRIWDTVTHFVPLNHSSSSVLTPTQPPGSLPGSLPATFFLLHSAARTLSPDAPMKCEPPLWFPGLSQPWSCPSSACIRHVLSSCLSYSLLTPWGKHQAPPPWRSPEATLSSLS